MQYMDSSARLINTRQLLTMWPVSQMTLWRHVKAGTFPTPINVGRRRYWKLDEVMAWIDQNRVVQTSL